MSGLYKIKYNPYRTHFSTFYSCYFASQLHHYSLCQCRIIIFIRHIISSADLKNVPDKSNLFQFSRIPLRNLITFADISPKQKMPLRPKTKRLLPENKVKKGNKTGNTKTTKRKHLALERGLRRIRTTISSSVIIAHKKEMSNLQKITSLPKQRGCCRGVNGDYIGSYVARKQHPASC